MVPTAEEFCRNRQILIVDNKTHTYTINASIKDFIEFAKLHCKEQARVISEKATTKIEETYAGSLGNENGELYNKIEVIDKDSILNAYDLNLIK